MPAKETVRHAYGSSRRCSKFFNSVHGKNLALGPTTVEWKATKNESDKYMSRL